MATQAPLSHDDVHARRDQTLKRIGVVPVNPGPLLAVLHASPTNPDKVASAIVRCPSLAARLLSVTNSAAFGLRQPISSVRRAVLHLGASRARSMALAFGLRTVHEGIGLEEPWLSQLWIASLRKACTAQLAGELIDPAQAESAFCLGLIQDVGLPLLVNLDPHYYQRQVVPASQDLWCTLERERFGIDHIELSMRLLRSWDADVEVRQAIHRHHQPPDLPAERDGDDAPAADANARMLISVPLYLASLVPHFDEELSAAQREWLVALPATFLAPTYASPDVFYQAAADLAAPLHADRPDTIPPREQFTAALVEAVTADAMGMVTQLSRLETALGRQREDMDNLRCQAFTDPLTKLLNRRGFTHLAERRLEIAASHGLSVCLLAMDLDHFKPINDRFGHEAGDRMLRGVAKLLRRSIDRNDLIARIGGDEFVILLCSLDEQQARAVVQRVAADCLDRRIKVIDAERGEARLRFSMGAVHVRHVEDNLGLEDLMHAADEAMYQGKREGRGGLVFRSLSSDEAMEETPPAAPGSCPLDAA